MIEHKKKESDQLLFKYYNKTCLTIYLLYNTLVYYNFTLFPYFNDVLSYKIAK